MQLHARHAERRVYADIRKTDILRIIEKWAPAMKIDDLRASLAVAVSEKKFLKKLQKIEQMLIYFIGITKTVKMEIERLVQIICVRLAVHGHSIF